MILNHFNHNCLISNSSLKVMIAKTFDQTKQNLLTTSQGAFGNDPKLARALDPLEKSEMGYVIEGNARLVFGCNHAVPAFKSDVKKLENSQKTNSEIYCARCEEKSVANKVIGSLERRAARISAAHYGGPGLPLEFIPSNLVIKEHSREELLFF
jgi:hypothetical protein